MMIDTLFDIGYIISAVIFIIGLQRLSRPDTARNGNLLAAGAMGLAVILTLFVSLEGASNNYLWIIAGLAVGSGIGWVASKRVEMTDMPQLVSLFNGLGGACAILISIVELYYFQETNAAKLATILFTLFVGGISFTGSLIAYGKLDGKIWDRSIPQVVNLLFLFASIFLIAFLIYQGTANFTLVLVVLALSLVYGITFVLPIGGADMPVVISLLNSFTGITAALAGIIYDNQIMLLGGILVGSSGTILTVLMCKAMNRSLLNVLIGSFGGSKTAGGSSESGEAQVAKSTNPNDTAVLLYYSNSVVIVPGYGLAVAQAQNVCKDLENALEKNGVSVKYAIHPVAGRMPGHMNVLLAEADVDYGKLMDLEVSNDALPNTDVVIVVGANDVVNPAAKTDPNSPIYGMPILDVEQAKHIIVLKRSMRVGYAGIQNQLFFHTKTKMLFGDAKDSIQKLVSEVKGLE